MGYETSPPEEIPEAVSRLAEFVQRQDLPRELAAEGKLREKMLPPDYPLAHLRRVDIPRKYARQVAAGAKIPAEILRSEAAETENLRVYLEDAFWGIMRREGDTLVWKAQIAPEQEADGPEKPQED